MNRQGMGLTLLLMLLALALLFRQPVAEARPTSYSYVVDTTSDGHDTNTSDSVCSNGVDGCSLRAAIEQAFNHSPANILFAANLSGTTLLLNNSLGTILWQDSDIYVSGLGTSVTVSGANLGAGKSIFQISGNNNTLYNVTVAHAPQDGIQIGDFYGVGAGNNNLIRSVTLIGNGGSGIYVGEGNGNTLSANYIGTRSDSATACVGGEGNQYGIYIGGSASGTVMEYNRVVCNSRDGVSINGSGGASNTSSFLNYVGTNSRTGMGNGWAGLAIYNGANGLNSNYDVLSGNGTIGLYIGGATTHNITVKNAYIGTSITGTVAVPNTADGVYIANVINGNITLGPNNVIGANGLMGVRIGGSSGVTVTLSTVGTDAYANLPLSNTLDGIELEAGTSSVLIFSNTLAFNTDGLEMVGGSHDNEAWGNHIQHNTLNGVSLNSGAYNNTIGGHADAYNFIGSNQQSGITISDSGTTTNTVQINQINGNGANGVIIQNGARANRVGDNTDYALENVMMVNLANGIALVNAPANFIGTNSLNANHEYGLLLDGANTTLTTITGTISVYNQYAGIGERNGAAFNVWTRVAMHDNLGLGIDKFADFGGTANIVNPPTAVITSVVKSSGTTTIRGTGINGSVIEFYTVAPDPSGFGEGLNFVGEATVSANRWTIVDPAGRMCFTFFERGFASSEFGANTCRTFLPLVKK